MLAFVHLEVAQGRPEDVIQRLIQFPGVVRTRTEVALRERVTHRVLPLVEAVGRPTGNPV